MPRTITFLNNWKTPTKFSYNGHPKRLRDLEQLAISFMEALDSRNLAIYHHGDDGIWQTLPMPSKGPTKRFSMPSPKTKFLVKELIGFTSSVEMAENSPLGRKYGLDFDRFNTIKEAVPEKERRAIRSTRKLWVGTLGELEDFLAKFDKARS